MRTSNLTHYVTMTHITAVYLTHKWLRQVDSLYSESPGPYVDCDPLQSIQNEFINQLKDTK
jgi:hypothetical protein